MTADAFRFDVRTAWERRKDVRNRLVHAFVRQDRKMFAAALRDEHDAFSDMMHATGRLLKEIQAEGNEAITFAARVLS